MAQQTSEKLRLPLMILAALSIAGFVWWLSVYTEPTQFAVAQEESEDDAARDAVGTMSLGAFEERYAELESGTRLRLRGVEVATSIGPMAFLTALPEGTPYVIRVMPTVEDPFFVAGDILDITGTVRTMSPEVLDGWEAEGVITDPAAREIAGFGVNFLEAEVLSPATQGDDAGSDEGSEGSDDDS